METISKYIILLQREAILESCQLSHFILQNATLHANPKFSAITHHPSGAHGLKRNSPHSLIYIFLSCLEGGKISVIGIGQRAINQYTKKQQRTHTYSVTQTPNNPAPRTKTLDGGVTTEGRSSKTAHHSCTSSLQRNHYSHAKSSSRKLRPSPACPSPSHRQV